MLFIGHLLSAFIYPGRQLTWEALGTPGATQAALRSERSKVSGLSPTFSTAYQLRFSGPSQSFSHANAIPLAMIAFCMQDRVAFSNLWSLLCG